MLRKGQKELVETYRNGYCGVPAIPGGGKTFALTKWAVQIITEEAEKPGKVLIVTYMSSAVNNFKQRIGNELEKRGITSRDYYVSTIHSLCLQIIKDKPDLVGINDEVEAIDQVKKFAILRDAVAVWKRRENNEKLYIWYLDEANLEKNGYDKVAKSWDPAFCNLMSIAISNFKTNNISVKEALKKTEALPAFSFVKVGAQIYAEYEQRLRRRGLIDFEDMLGKAKYILENDATVLAKYRKKYTFVCEDEAQDSNRVQTEILTLIAGENGNFLRVGDSNQAIMTTFANSDMKLFKEFCQSRADKVFHIVESSRNTNQIIELANNFVRYVRESHPTTTCRDSLLPQFIEPVAKGDEFPNPVVNGDGIFFEEYSKKEDELFGIAKKGKELISEFPEKTTAVLLPDAYKIRDLIKILDNEKMPYDYLDNYSDERNGVLVTLGRIIDFIAAPERSDKLIEVMSSFTNEETVGREELIEFLRKEKTEELLYPVSGEMNLRRIGKELRETKAWETFMEVRELLIDFLEFPFNIQEKLVLYIAEKLNFGREETAIAQKVASNIKFLQEGNLRFKLSDLAFELLQQKSSFSYFANLVWELKGYEAKPGVITIATYHKSKGLEWDNVLLGSLNADDFPTRVNDKFKEELYYLRAICRNPSGLLKKDMAVILGDKSEIDYNLQSKYEIIGERARLLYVGITRAKERLFISAVNSGRTKESEYFKFLCKVN